MGKKANELRELSVTELFGRTDKLKGELFKLRNEAKTGTIEKPNKIKEIKRQIARIHTVIKEKGDERNK